MGRSEHRLRERTWHVISHSALPPSASSIKAHVALLHRSASQKYWSVSSYCPFFSTHILLYSSKIVFLQNIAIQFAPACVEIHKSMKDLSTKFFEDTGRHYYVTPSSYLKFLESFTQILSIRQEVMQTKR